MGSGPRFGLQLRSADDRNGGHLEGDWAVVAFSPSDLGNLDLRSPGAGQAAQAPWAGGGLFSPLQLASMAVQEPSGRGNCILHKWEARSLTIAQLL